MAHAAPGKRVPARHGAARSGGAPVQLHRQDQRARDVLCEPVDQEGPDRISRRVGRPRHRVQLPGLAQLDVDITGRLRHEHQRRRERIHLGRQYRPRIWHRVACAAHPAAWTCGARPGRHPREPERRAAPVLLVDERGRGGRRRLAPDLPDALHGIARVHAHRSVARGCRRPGPERDPEPDGWAGVDVHLRQPRAVHRRVSPPQRYRGGPRGLACRPADEEGVVVGRGCGRTVVARRALRQPQRLRRAAGRPVPQPGDLRVSTAAGIHPLHRALGSGPRHRSLHPGDHGRSRACRAHDRAGTRDRAERHARAPRGTAADIRGHAERGRRGPRSRTRRDFHQVVRPPDRFGSVHD